MAWRKGPNPEHLAKLEEGVEAWNAWRKKNPEVRPDLSGATLTRAKLVGAKLVGAKLVGADLSGADLRNADFVGADLEYTNLTGADLRGANLKSADLKSASLMATNLRGATLVGTGLATAWLLDTDFHQLDLREVKGLETVKHQGPSSIGSKTLAMSQGQIPDTFLKGCGFPEWAIESAKLYNPDLRSDQIMDITYRITDMRTNSPIVPLSVFISYSNKDMDFIEKLEARFDKDGIRSWRDVKDMVAGPIEGQIDRSIRLQKVVLLVISKNSIRSDWVEWEVRKARELQKDLQEKSDKTVHVLCPVAIDKAWWESNPWPERLRDQVQEYNIVDLSEWEEDKAFEAQYEKLRKGLGIFYRNEIEGGAGDGA